VVSATAAESRGVSVLMSASAAGATVRDHVRSIVVINDDGELAVAVREAIAREVAVVHDARPAEAAAAQLACRPWPWMVIGRGSEVLAATRELARRQPVLVLWLGELPSGLPAHARSMARFAELIDAVWESARHAVGGMRLCSGAGVDLPDGGLAQSAALQALVSQHPRGFDLPTRSFRSAAQTLVRERIAWRPVTSPLAGGVVLTPCAAAAQALG
jgi:hypothetical protein